MVGLVAACLLIWALSRVLILLFAATLFGVALARSARWFAERTRIPPRGALSLIVTAIALAAMGFSYLAGVRVLSQVDGLSERIPSALGELESRLEGHPLLGAAASEFEGVRERLNGTASDAGTLGIFNAFRVTLGTLSQVLVCLVLTLYLAGEPSLYRRSAVRLVPPRWRDTARDLFGHWSSALGWWLAGRLLSMAVVAVLTIVGLLLLGMPLAFVLGLIAGLLSFVPFLGPIAAAIPALLVAFGESQSMLIAVAALYGAIQFLESYLITPRIARHTVSVPAALLIGAQVVMGTLIGLPGVMFATPLVVTVAVFLQVVYLREFLGEDVSIWGHHAASS